MKDFDATRKPSPSYDCGWSGTGAASIKIDATLPTFRLLMWMSALEKAVRQTLRQEPVFLSRSLLAIR